MNSVFLLWMAVTLPSHGAFPSRSRSFRCSSFSAPSGSSQSLPDGSPKSAATKKLDSSCVVCAVLMLQENQRPLPNTKISTTLLLWKRRNRPTTHTCTCSLALGRASYTPAGVFSSSFGCRSSRYFTHLWSTCTTCRCRQADTE